MAMKRRTLLAAGLGAAAWLGGRPAIAAEAAHPDDAGDADLGIVNRLTWGADSRSLAEYGRLGRRDYIARQLHPDAAAGLPPAVEARIGALGSMRQPMLAAVAELQRQRRAADALIDDAAKQAARRDYRRALDGLANDAATRALLRAVHAPNPLQDQMTWFWFNHFNVHRRKANVGAMVGDYEDHLRPHALGRFRDLLLASATHAAMIRYLDNEQNAAGHLNENYARELMELHTLGVDGGYAQQDVQELARVLTGLGLELGDAAPGRRAVAVGNAGVVFRPARHDMGTKHVLGVAIEGRGWDEIEAQLLRLARHPATARHVSRRLATWFVADEPPAALAERMQHAYTASDGDIAVTLQAMFDAPEFAASLGRKFKDPIHYVVSAVRLVGDGQVLTDAAPLAGWLDRLGEGLYNRATPDGYPLAAAAWSGSGQLSTRFEIAQAIGSGRVPAFDAPAAWQDGAAARAIAATFGPRTRAALEAARTPQERTALFLSAPEFMVR
ncbi:MAG: DUF1800 domain-containing protein [Proteobacteria bacterium]|nr:DUF1800 domain-containing protein [Pseudomonadota bacterium]